MSSLNLYAIAEELRNGETRKIVEGEEFTLFLTKKSKSIEEGAGKLHTCGKDEFFYVLKGEGEIIVGGTKHLLKEGEAIMVSAGEKHTSGTQTNVCWLWISKHPHKHVFYG